MTNQGLCLQGMSHFLLFKFLLNAEQKAQGSYHHRGNNTINMLNPFK